MTSGQIQTRQGAPFEGEITVPGDKSISHRAVMLAALSNGSCRITNFLEGEDCQSTLRIVEDLGVRTERLSAGDILIHGCGGQFTPPKGDLDCGNSGTTMRLMAGILASQPFTCRLTGDASLHKRPMKRVILPLTQMSACLRAEGAGDTPPLRIEGGALRGISYESPIASAQVKSAILLAGLSARGVTTITEPTASRDHTERMMQYFGVKLHREALRPEKNRSGGPARVTLEGGQKMEGRDFRVPGDISSAAFWLVAAGARPGSRILLREVGLNPTRSGVLTVLVRMGARLREIVEDSENGEPRGAIDVRGASLRGTIIEGEEVAHVIDELPALAVAAALASGKTIIRDAAELRVKETDRIAAVVANLRALGAQVEERPDGMVITGGAPLRGARLPSFGDHRIAMAFAVAGLFASGETLIEDADCVDISYPGFARTLTLFQQGGRRQWIPVLSGAGRPATSPKA